MKTLQIFLVFTLFLCFNSKAQYTNNLGVNLQVSEASQEGNTAASTTTTCGKTYVVYYCGINELRIQLLDENGVKLFGNNGVYISSYGLSYSMVDQVALLCDKNENAIVIFSNGGNNQTIEAYKFNDKGTILASHQLGSGMNPLAAELPNNEIVIAWSNLNNETEIQKMSTSFNPIFSNVKKYQYEAKNIQVLANGNFYLTSYKLYLMAAGYADTYAMLYKENANPEWNSEVKISSNTNSSIYTSKVSCVLGNKNELYVANTYFDGNVDRRAFLQCIDINGNIQFGNTGIKLGDDQWLNYHLRTQIIKDKNSSDIIALFSAEHYDLSSKVYTPNIFVQKISNTGALLLGNNGKLLIDSTIDPFVIGIQRSGMDFKMAYIQNTNQQIKCITFDVNGTGNNYDNICITSGKKDYRGSVLNKPINNSMVLIFEENRNGVQNIFAQNMFAESETSNCETEKSKYFIPNVFTPNNDGYNDIFEITVEGYSVEKLKIFNRWGELIFESTDQMKAWDGKVNGNSAGASTYYYTVSLKDIKTNNASEQTGFITLFQNE